MNESQLNSSILYHVTKWMVNLKDTKVKCKNFEKIKVNIEMDSNEFGNDNENHSEMKKKSISFNTMKEQI